MAGALPSLVATKFRINKPLPSLVEGRKFIKWVNGDDNNSSPAIVVDLFCDPKNFILYWRDLSKKKSEYLELSSIRDVKTGIYAYVPVEKSQRDMLSSGKSNASIQAKTITIIYGTDFCQNQSINFVCLADNAEEIAKEWSDFIFKSATSPRMLNLSIYEQLMKLHSILLYGKAVLDEKMRTFCVPVSIFIDTFIGFTNGWRQEQAERQHIAHILDAVGLPSSKTDYLDPKNLNEEKFFLFFYMIVSKSDVDQILNNYSDSKSKLSLNCDQFERFLNSEQRHPGLNELLYPFYTREKTAELMEKLKTETKQQNKDLNSFGMMRWLMDYENEVINPINYELHEDMEQPLASYFINSSHNTYLSGHQITGKSDPEMYRQILLSGCRCIELDTWPNPALDEPIITHGHTFCTQILFKDAIEAINESAFKTSPYPVILSFENYCGTRMQEKMKKYLIDILGDKLLKEPLAAYPLEPGIRLPSPEDLKYKILCKFRNKKPKKSNKEKLTANNSSKEDSEFMNLPTPDQTFFNSEFTNPTPDSRHDTRLPSSDIIGSNSLFSQESSSEEACQCSELKTEMLEQLCDHLEQHKTRPSDLTLIIQNQSDTDSEKDDILSPLQRDSFSIQLDFRKESTAYYYDSCESRGMASIVNYILPYTFRSFEHSRKRERYFEMSSFNENTAFNLHKEKPSEFVNYNKRQISRIYPKGTRISSDNYLPQIFWNVGCQMVALNYQTLDIGMQLNNGKFEYNNRCGYLLKPEIMRRTNVNKQFDPFAESPIDGIVATTLKIRILSGIYLTNVSDTSKHIGQSVTVELFGLPADSVRNNRSHKVKATLYSNSFNVSYADSTGYQFRKIIMPALATLAVTVFDEQGKVFGRRFLPVDGLRPGYRYISLKNESNQPMNMCALFVHIVLQDYVPDHFEELASALVDPISYVQTQERKEEMLRILCEENDVIGDEGRTGEEEGRWCGEVETSPLTPLQIALRDQSERRNRGVPKKDSISETKNDLVELETDWKKTYQECTTRTDETNIFSEPSISALKESKSYAQLSKPFSKKVEKIEKDLEKRQSELEHSLLAKIEECREDADKRKHRKEKKSEMKQVLKDKFSMFKSVDSASSKSSAELTRIDEDFSNFKKQTQKSHVKLMIDANTENQLIIKNTKISAIEILSDHLEKLVKEILDKRTKKLRAFNEKDLSILNKLTVHHIQLKKKRIAQSGELSKEEIQRLAREVEKECVAFAVRESTKLDELLQMRENKLRKVIQNSMKEINDLKVKNIALYEKEFQASVDTVSFEYERMFLPESERSTNQANLKTLETQTEFTTQL